MKNQMKFPFEEPDFPVDISPYCTSKIDSVEAARCALHEAIEIKYFYEGTSTLLIGTETVVAQVGDVIVINPYEFHATIDLGEEQGKYSRIMVEPAFFLNMDTNIPDLRSLLLSGKVAFRTQFRGDERMQSIILRIVEEKKSRGPYYHLAVRGLLLELMALLLDYGMKNTDGCNARGQATRYYAVVEPALRHIRDNYAERCTVEEMAELCAVSKYHFCRVFKDVTGLTAMQYLNKYRIRIAETLLENTDKSIGEIAGICGFESEGYFCRCYKKFVGTTPRQKRKL